MKRLFTAIIISIVMAISLTVMANAEELTIYIDQSTTVEASAQNGTREAPYSKIETALGKVKNTAADKIVVFLMSDYTQPTGGSGLGIANKTVIYTAESDTTQFKLPNGSIYPAPTAGSTGTFGFENITLVKGLSANDRYDIALRCFNLIIGEGTKTTGGTIGITQVWNGENAISDQRIDIDSDTWTNFQIDFGTYIAGSVKGNATININGKTTAHILGAGYRAAGADFYGTQNYILNSGATIRELFFGKASAQHGKRYVQVNAKVGLIDLYTTGDSGSLTSDSYSGVNIIEINEAATINRTGGEATTGGSGNTEPANYKKINAYPNSEEAWKNVTRVVIFNNNVLGDTEVADTAAIVLRVAAGGKAQAVTTEPTAENNWDCELLGFEITLPEGKDLVYIGGELAEANEDGLYVIENAGENKVTFGSKYTVTIGDASEKYVPGAKITIPEAPEKENGEHYTFKWSDGENTYEAGAEYTVNSDVTFTEVWTAKTYTVKFVSGEDTVSEEALAYDSTITAPASPVLDGHTFDGWYNGDVKFEEGTKVTGEVTYTAKYTKNSYDIEINAVPTEGGAVEGAGKYEYGTNITLTAVANFGYNFDGWYIGEEKVGDAPSLEVEVKNAVTYIAKFVTAPVEVKAIVVLAREEGTPYSVTYEDGTTYNNAAKITVYDGDKVAFEGSESENGALEFNVEVELGKTYRVVVVKNGYLTYDEETEVKTGNELSAIELVPGDIKGDYSDECGDGIVDIDDFIRVLRGFAANEGDKLFHAVDINEDRSINVTDLGYVKAAMSK